MRRVRDIGPDLWVNFCRVGTMANSSVPHLANDAGAEKIFVGSLEIKCMGARPPFDHPHVFLDLGADRQTLCPYCSTLYVYDSRLGAGESDPPGSLVAPSEEGST